MTKNISRDAGFSLIEMILVLAILALGFFPMIQLFSSGITASSSTGKKTTGMQLSQQKMENIKGLQYSGLVNSSEAKGTISGFADYSRVTSVEENPVNLKKVIVTTYWGTGSKTASFELSTYISSY